jgi:glycerol dehydrogenase
MLPTRPTLASTAIAHACYDTLFDFGEAAREAVLRKEANEALERVVEANTLLSGVGFESGGLGAAHAVAQALTVIPSVEKEFLHGEMVALGACCVGQSFTSVRDERKRENEWE